MPAKRTAIRGNTRPKEASQRSPAATGPGTFELLDAVGNAILVVDTSTRCIVHANPRALALLDRTAAEVVGRVCHEFICPAERQRCPIVDLGGTVDHAERVLLTRDGGRLPILKTVERSQVGGRDVLIESFIDLTNQKAADEEVRRERDRARQQFDLVGVMLVALDRNGLVTIVNRRACEILGRSEQELLGTNWFETCVPEGVRRSVRGVFLRLMADEVELARAHENAVLNGSGEERLIAWRNTVLRDETGHPVGTLSAGEDITELRRSADALKLNEERLEALLKLAQLGGSEEDKLIEFALEEAVRLTGSRIGYLHFVHENQVDLEQGRWSRAVLAACTAEKMRHYPIERAGVWADCVRLRRPVVHNDYPRLAEKKGLPEGHFPVLRHMSVPVFDGPRIVAVAGVGNKDEPYDDADVRQLTLFASGLFAILKDRRSAETMLRKLRKTLGSTVEAISRALETRDPYAAGHQRRVAHLARAIASELGLDAERIDAVGLASSIHDIGKLSVPAEILAKPAKLTAIEFGLIKLHPRIGFEMLAPVEFPWPLHEFILQHHERLDGSGYPDGLRGDAILPEARIIAVADVVEAMAAHRPYRPALGIAAALDEIRHQQGRQLDADAVTACVRLFVERAYKLPE